MSQMKLTSSIALLLLCYGSLVSHCAAQAKELFSIYYISIGSQNYEEDFSTYETGFSGFVNLKAAKTSAQFISKIFDSSGATYGETILSTKESLITKQRVLKSVNNVLKKIWLDKKKNPLLIFYFCGHGISEGFGWNLFLIPGDFIINPAASDALKMDKHSISLTTLWDAIHETNKQLPFVILADCCYEGNDRRQEIEELQKMDNSIAEAMKLAGNVSAIIRNMNEFREESAVVFAAPPGTQARTVPHPFLKIETEIGPLCRRTLLAFCKPTITWREWIDFLAERVADSETHPAVTFWEGNKKENYLIKRGSKK